MPTEEKKNDRPAWAMNPSRRRLESRDPTSGPNAKADLSDLKSMLQEGKRTGLKDPANKADLSDLRSMLKEARISNEDARRALQSKDDMRSVLKKGRSGLGEARPKPPTRFRNPFKHRMDVT
jgi:hypothetical protein